MRGCYVPFDWEKDFSEEYLDCIRYYCLVMSERYIKNNFETIKGKENVIEKRLTDDYTLEEALTDNAKILELAKKHGVNYLLIDDGYNLEINL